METGSYSGLLLLMLGLSPPNPGVTLYSYVHLQNSMGGQSKLQPQYLISNILLLNFTDARVKTGLLPFKFPNEFAEQAVLANL